MMPNLIQTKALPTVTKPVERARTSSLFTTILRRQQQLHNPSLRLLRIIKHLILIPLRTNPRFRLYPEIRPILRYLPQRHPVDELQFKQPLIQQHLLHRFYRQTLHRALIPQIVHLPNQIT